ncbi:unnamed protein product [Diatraea saccharalis]|uniref:SV2A/B/C luminal domain-containing protein n=1 Tax=Diatraea saccharalis TaxID=40085 RepID=A0A9N9WIK2_9NEOP|nr:unnamed protein product [Diatraea saccharalis]
MFYRCYGLQRPQLEKAKMEEQACLVRARSDSETSSKLSFGSISRTMAYTDDRLTATEGAGEPGNTVNMAASAPDHTTESNESGELLDYNDCSVLEQFHEDALKQAGCGLSQARVLLACGLAIGGSALELAAIPFILPSAEIELCILRHEKSWLVGASLGSVGWGALCERLGRRRTLLSSLAVNAVFAAVAAFMPTYGTFMMARFCSAIGSGGVTPACYSYAYETVPRLCRRRALAALPLCAGAGALSAAALARAALPPTGADTLLEDREHFSAWHRTFTPATSFVYAESLKWVVLTLNTDSENLLYPANGGRPRYITCGTASKWLVSIQTTLNTRFLASVLPAVLWRLQEYYSFTRRCHAFYASYTATVVAKENALLEASKHIEQNATYEKQLYNQTLENIEFANVTFVECTFRDMLMSRASFRNCSFAGVAFANIKTSNTGFFGCSFVNTTIIDSDIEMGRELDEWCVLRNTVIRGMRGGCRADLSSSLAGLVAEQSYAAHAMLLAAAVAAAPTHPRAIGQSNTLALAELRRANTPTCDSVPMRSVLVTIPLALHSAECTAHGLILSVAYMGAAILRGVGDTNAILSSVLCCCLALASTALATQTKHIEHR